AIDDWVGIDACPDTCITGPCTMVCAGAACWPVVGWPSVGWWVAELQAAAESARGASTRASDKRVRECIRVFTFTMVGWQGRGSRTDGPGERPRTPATAAGRSASKRREPA